MVWYAYTHYSLSDENKEKYKNKDHNTLVFISKSIEKFGNVLDYSLCEYKNGFEKTKLICKIHGIFEITPLEHYRSKEVCEQCAEINLKQISTKKFIEKSKEKHGDKFDYSLTNYESCRGKVLIICKEHGVFKTRYDTHIKSKYRACPKCSNTEKLNIDRFIEKARIKHGDKYDYSLVKYEKSYKKVKIICKKHGVFEQKPSKHFRNGCLECCGLKLRTTEDFIEECKLVHNNKYNYDKTVYKNAKEKIIITCPKHGDFYQKATSHLHSRRGCKKCIGFVSKNEILWLNSLNIPNDKIHRDVIIVINNKRYQVDGYNPETKTVYEFDGDYWHGNPEKYDSNKIHPEYGGKTFGQIYQKTLNKRIIFEKAGYKVIWIWESDFLSRCK